MRAYLYTRETPANPFRARSPHVCVLKDIIKTKINNKKTRAYLVRSPNTRLSNVEAERVTKNLKHKKKKGVSTPVCSRNSLPVSSI